MKHGIYTYKIDKNYMNFFDMKLVYLLAFYVVNKFSYDDIFIEKFMNIRFCDKRFM